MNTPSHVARIAIEHTRAMINIQSSTVAFTTVWVCTVSTHYDVIDIRNTASLKTVPTPAGAHYGNTIDCTPGELLRRIWTLGSRLYVTVQ